MNFLFPRDTFCYFSIALSRQLKKCEQFNGLLSPCFHENVESLEDFWSLCSLFCFLSFGCVIIGGGRGRRREGCWFFIPRAVNSYKEKLKKMLLFPLSEKAVQPSSFLQDSVIYLYSDSSVNKMVTVLADRKQTPSCLPL